MSEAVDTVAIEVKPPASGLLAAGATISLILAAVVLLDPAGHLGGTGKLERWLLVPLIALVTLALLMSAVRAARALRLPVLTGVEAMAGKPAVAISVFASDGALFRGMVFANGARWQAISAAPVGDRTKLVVVRVVSGPTRLVVTRVEKGTA